MRVVVDTNVIVSGLLNPHGAPGRVLDLLVAERLELLADDRILAEYREVLLRPRFGFDPADVETLLAHLQTTSVAVISDPLDMELSDPGDLPFLEVAVFGKAESLLTGNLRHFPRSKKKLFGVKVLSPSYFLAEIQDHQPVKYTL